ncbi:MAG: carboxypeptidase regulatory-like domain-containing protein, partial [Candidatus Rokuibacteriota bacterium]
TLQCTGKVFCPDQEIDVTNADVTLTVPVFRAAVVTGTLDAKGGPLPAEIAIQGRLVDEGDRKLEFLERAPVARGHFETRLPTVTLDLRIAAEPYAPAYLWSVTPRLPVTQLVRIDLTAGASMSGRLIDEAGSGLPAVLLRARPAASHPGDVAERLEAQAATISTERRGYFQFTRLEPGPYHVEALSPPLYQRPLRIAEGVSVESDAETRLGDITVRAPARLEVSVTLDSARELDLRPAYWRATLRSAEPDVQTPWTKTSRLDKQGRAVFDRLNAGPYVVSIGHEDAGGSEFAAREIDVSRDHSVQLTVNLIRVQGVVTLGNVPLQAELDLYGDGGARNVFTVDPQGRFEGWMRRPDTRTLLAHVRAPSPVVDTLKRISLDSTDADSLDLAIALDNYRVTGSVVDEDGTALSGAAVRSGLVEALTDARGQFELSGLAEGTHMVEAVAGGFADGIAQHVALHKDQPAASLAFVLTRGRSSIVRLTDESGRGLPGVTFFLDWPGRVR